MKDEELKDILNVLTNVAQLLDGWHNDGTCWSEWDESVRKDVSRIQTKLYHKLDKADGPIKAVPMGKVWNAKAER
jgi:hypothetical protein